MRREENVKTKKWHNLKFSDQIIKHKELLYLQEVREVRNCKHTPLPNTNELFLRIMKEERNKITSI